MFYSKKILSTRLHILIIINFLCVIWKHLSEFEYKYVIFEYLPVSSFLLLSYCSKNMLAKSFTTYSVKIYIPIFSRTAVYVWI